MLGINLNPTHFKLQALKVEIVSFRRDEFDAYSSITHSSNVFGLPFYYKFMLVLLEFEIVGIYIFITAP